MSDEQQFTSSERLDCVDGANHRNERNCVEYALVKGFFWSVNCSCFISGNILKKFAQIATNGRISREYVEKANCDGGPGCSSIVIIRKKTLFYWNFFSFCGVCRLEKLENTFCLEGTSHGFVNLINRFDCIGAPALHQVEFGWVISLHKQQIDDRKKGNCGSQKHKNLPLMTRCQLICRRIGEEEQI